MTLSVLAMNLENEIMKISLIGNQNHLRKKK